MKNKKSNKNKISCFVYKGSVLILEENFEGVFNENGLYVWMGSNEKMIEMWGDGVEEEWIVEEKKNRFGEVYCYNFSYDESDYWMKFVNRDGRV